MHAVKLACCGVGRCARQADGERRQLARKGPNEGPLRRSNGARVVTTEKRSRPRARALFSVRRGHKLRLGRCASYGA